MHGCMKVDDRCRGWMSGCRSCMEQVTDVEEGVSECGDAWGRVSTDMCLV